MGEDDRTLLRRFAATRAEEAFSELVRRNMDAVYSAALRRVGGDAHLARDVAQEVFVILSRQADQLTNHPVLVAWLYTTTRNAAANLVRSERRRKAREKEAQSMHDSFTQPERSGDWREIAPFLDEAVDRLNETDRRVVILRFFERHTFVEIGARLRLTEDAARMRADRAIHKLRLLLARHGIQSSTAALGSVLAHHAVSAAPADLIESAILSASKSQTVETGIRFNSLGLSIIISGITITGAVATILHERSRSHTLERAIQQEEQRIQDMERSSFVLRRSVAPDSNPSVSSVPREQTPSLPTRMKGGRKLTLSVMYADFYTNLQLTPSQIEQFESINLQGPGNGVWTAEIPANAMLPAPTVAPPLSSEEIAAQLCDLLGDAAYQEYKEYSRRIPSRAIAAQLASSVYLTDPISPDQADRLTRILETESTANRAGETIERPAFNWDAVIAQATSVLTPMQMAALRAVQRQHDFERAMLREIKARTAAPAPTQR